MKTLLICLPIVFEAISEGLYLRGENGKRIFKVISKQVQVLMIASWFYVLWLAVQGEFPQYWKLVAIYLLVRVIIFNYIHNISAGLDIIYIGNVSIIDKFVALACLKQYWMYIIVQGICLIFLICILTGKI